MSYDVHGKSRYIVPTILGHIFGRQYIVTLHTYFDASKAFDSVWIDGLFHQLHNLGKVWKLLSYC